MSEEMARTEAIENLEKLKAFLDINGVFTVSDAIKKSIDIAIASLETDEAYQLEFERTTTPQETRWIPVSERLPKDNDYHTCIENVDGAVIWCTDKGIIGLGWYYESTKKWGGLDDIFLEKWGEVIAWMPLPKAYREVEE